MDELFLWMEQYAAAVSAGAAVLNLIVVVVLVAITGWYAWSTHRMLGQMAAQSKAITQQAEAAQKSLDRLTLAGLPEWDLKFGHDPQANSITITNNGESPGRNIQYELQPPGNEKLIVYSKSSALGDRQVPSVVPPGDLFLLIAVSKDPPYEGDLLVQSTGRWGVRQVTRWHIRFYRHDRRFHEFLLDLSSPTIEVVSRPSVTFCP